LEFYKPHTQNILKKLTLYRLRAKVQFTDVSDTFFAVATWGDTSILTGQKDPRDERLGLRFITTEEPAAPLATADDYHAHRIAFTIPEMPEDLISGESFPLPSNLEEIQAIDYKKGCYVGQEVTARSKYRGNIRKKIYTVNIEGSAPAAGTPIRSGEQVVGTMLSHSGSIGLAQIESEIAAQKTPLQAGGATLTVK